MATEDFEIVVNEEAKIFLQEIKDEVANFEKIKNDLKEEIKKEVLEELNVSLGSI